MKESNSNINETEISAMLYNIVQYLWGSNKIRKTMQKLIGIENLFYGYIVKNLFKTIKIIKYRKLN